MAHADGQHDEEKARGEIHGCARFEEKRVDHGPQLGYGQSSRLGYFHRGRRPDYLFELFGYNCFSLFPWKTTYFLVSGATGRDEEIVIELSHGE